MQQTMETFQDFTFDAAHELQPFSGVHGHTFKVRLHFRGQPHPRFGWAVNLYEVGEKVEAIKLQIDHSMLNTIDGLSDPSLENICMWMWQKLKCDCPELSQISMSRGFEGQAEGCVYSG